MHSLVKHKRRLHGYSAESRVWENLDLRSAQAFGSTWKGCEFIRCDFSASNFSNTTFENCEFTECTGTLANFGLCKMSDVVVRGGSWEQANFTVSILKRTTFTGVRLCYATFAETLVTNLAFPDCNLHGADLRFLEAFGVDFTGANLWGASVAIGCQFFNGVFDQKQCQIFQALVARRYPVAYIGDRMRELAGEEMPLVERLMRSDDEHD